MATDKPIIKHKPTVPFDYGSLREDAVTFYINKKSYDGFLNVSIDRNMTSMTGTFSITVTDKWKVDQEDFEIKPGQEIHCHLGKDALFQGYIDKLNLSLSPTSRNITISGRDKTGDLVDCSIKADAEYNDLNFTGIAKELCKPFGILVIAETDVGANFPKFSVRQGETVFEALERGAKERELLLQSTTHGNLLITKRSSSRSSTELIEGVNVMSASASFDNTQRFSEYIIKGQSTGLLGDAKDATQNQGTATDEGITRYRPTIIIAENAVDNDGAQKRAQFEATFKSAKASQVSLTVRGWNQKDGSLWKVNQLVQVDCRSIGIKARMLVQKVKFSQAKGQGQKVEMELIRKDAFKSDVKKIKKKDDILDGLGWDDKK